MMKRIKKMHTKPMITTAVALTVSNDVNLNLRVFFSIFYYNISKYTFFLSVYVGSIFL